MSATVQFVAFDLETGGLDFRRHPVIQIAAIAVGTDWSELETFEAKVRFDIETAESQALEVNHYDPVVWAREAKAPAVVIGEFSAFLGRHATIEMRGRKPPHRPYQVAKLCGHNAAAFDGPFLQAWYKRHDAFLPADPRVRCTCQRALWYFDALGVAPADFKLGTLCSYFGIELGDAAHDALADGRATVALARALSEAPTVPSVHLPRNPLQEATACPG